MTKERLEELGWKFDKFWNDRAFYSLSKDSHFAIFEYDGWGLIDPFAKEFELLYCDLTDEEIIEEVESVYDFNYKQFIKDIAEEYSPDDYHKLICDILGVGYYDKDGFKERMKEFINKLNKNNYNIKYDED